MGTVLPGSMYQLAEPPLVGSKPTKSRAYAPPTGISTALAHHSRMVARFLADLVLVLHIGYAGFVVVGLVLIVLGIFLRWRWVRNFWFRVAHLLAIALVAAEAIFAYECPLTTLENYMREQAGEARYAGDFIPHWLGQVIPFELPIADFVWLHAGLAVVVLLTFVLAPPRPPWRRARPAA